MADEYGLSQQGFKQKRLTDIIQSMNSRIADQLGVQISTEANSVFGQLIGVFSYEIADLWEQTAQVYGAMYPHTASGRARRAASMSDPGSEGFLRSRRIIGRAVRLRPDDPEPLHTAECRHGSKGRPYFRDLSGG